MQGGFSFDAVFIEYFQNVFSCTMGLNVQLYVPGINIVAVSYAAQQQFKSEYFEYMRVGEGPFDRGVHAGIQCIYDAGVDKVVSSQKLAYLVKSRQGFPHLCDGDMPSVTAAAIAAGEYRIHRAAKHTCEIRKD